MSETARPRLEEHIGLFLSSIEQGREVRRYLSLFQRAKDRPFAVIKIGGALLGGDLSGLGRRLALLQSLGLTPIVVYGAGPQLDRHLAEAGIETPRKNGLRVTPPEAMPILTDVTHRLGLQLAQAIGAHGGRASVTPSSAMLGVLNEASGLGRAVAKVSFKPGGIAPILAEGSVPLVPCIAQTSEGVLVNVNADRATRAIAAEVSPLKVVFLTGTGGVKGPEGALIDVIHLESDMPALREAPWLHSGMRLKLEEIAELLGELPFSSSVSMTDTEHMLKELFTDGGAGTLIRRGERWITEEGFDREACTPIIEAAFAKPLKPGFWEGLREGYTIRSAGGRAAILVTTGQGYDVLNKFAVSPEARGEGLAKQLFQMAADRSPSLIWRARTDNPFNGFYSQQADGFLRRGDWAVFWTGEIGAAEAERFADAVAGSPTDFGEGGSA